MSLTKVWHRPSLATSPDWPLRRQVQALRRALAGDPSLFNLMPSQAVDEESVEPAEYVGLFRRRADDLETAGKPLEAISLRLRKGLLRT